MTPHQGAPSFQCVYLFRSVDAGLGVGPLPPPARSAAIPDKSVDSTRVFYINAVLLTLLTPTSVMRVPSLRLSTVLPPVLVCPAIAVAAAPEA